MAERIGAIETIYAGHKFRSRLEARWAVFFDAVGVPWKYEPQGFESGAYRWLPDFHLPEAQAWVEVKGDPDGLRNDFEKLRAVWMSGAVPDMEASADGAPNSSGVLILGDIPAFSESIIFHPLIQHSHGQGLCRHWGGFLSAKGKGHLLPERGDGFLGGAAFVRNKVHLESDRDSDGWGTGYRDIGVNFGLLTCRDAYTQARQARFEHGQSGAA